MWGTRRVARTVVVLTAALLIAASAAPRAEAAGHDVGPRPPGRFDYYVLALSWVPGFCASHRGRPAECASGRGFALHGLWPQLNGGDHPSDCAGPALEPDEARGYGRLYASPALIAHEWSRHGTCSGLTPSDYFALTARVARRVRLPAALNGEVTLRADDARSVGAAFVNANVGLPLAGVRVATERGVVTEVEICITKRGNFRAC